MDASMNNTVQVTPEENQSSMAFAYRMVAGSFRIRSTIRNALNLITERDSLRQRVAELQAEQGALTARLEQAEAERTALAQGKADAWDDRHADRTLHHHPHRLAGALAVVAEDAPGDDAELISRVAAAYRRAVRTPIGPKDSAWLSTFAEYNRAAHETLESGDDAAAARLLRNPASSMLFYGFHSVHSAYVSKNEEERWQRWRHRQAYDNLLQLTRAVGIRRVENPEANHDFDEAPGVETLLEELDAEFGFRIEFPNLFAGEIGLATSRGVAHYRALQALYQAWRIRRLLRDVPRPRVLEIGAGLGLTAYYATKLGLTDYTIIDIPMTNVAQGYFLGRVLGPQAISLWGETAAATVRVLPPVAYQDRDDRFDLIVNVDSLTEMAEPTAREYLERAAGKTPRFLSINHEHNAFTVAELCRGRRDTRIERAPCWARRGYVEELIEFQSR